jgi:radical SAM protein with 4Fe4S-binding SPASM domain
VPASLDELAILRDSLEASRKSTELTFTIGMTMACNFACPYCFEEHRPEHMSAETAAAVRAFVAKRTDEARATSVYVNWFGGEPLLNVEVLVALAEGIQEDARARGATFDSLVITNGALLTRDAAERLAAAGVRRVQVTLDGPPAVHDGAMAMYTAKLTTYTEQVQMAWKPLRQSDLEGLGEGLDATLASMGMAPPPKPSALLRAFEPGSCSALVDHSFVIGPGGLLFKCELGIHDQREAVGSVHATPPAAPAAARRRLPLASDAVGSRAHDWGAYNPFDNAKCSGCRYVPMCKGGCPKRVLESDHEFMAGTCEYWDHNIERLVTEYAG